MRLHKVYPTQLQMVLLSYPAVMKLFINNQHVMAQLFEKHGVSGIADWVRNQFHFTGSLRRKTAGFRHRSCSIS